jgi:hypothetical protein
MGIKTNRMSFLRGSHRDMQLDDMNNTSSTKTGREHRSYYGISYHLVIYSICRCCWNVTTYKGKVHNMKIEIISFVIKFLLSLSIRPRYETSPIHKHEHIPRKPSL